MVYSGAVDRIVGRPPPKTGDIVLVTNESEKPIAWGIYNSVSMFSVRLMQMEEDANRDPSSILDMELLLQSRMNDALDLRRRLELPRSDTNVYRLVNSQGDRLSGLIVDVFGNHAVIASSAAWVEKYRSVIELLVRQIPEIDDIKWRPSVEILKEEGLNIDIECEEPISTENRVKVMENGINYIISLEGQKTGFYADQRDNRLLVGSLSKGRTVLDMCCYSGGFALNAAFGGAVHVTGNDVSIQGIMVPTKTNRYRNLNGLAMCLTKKGGLLMTCSCSGAMTQSGSFLSVLQRAASSVGRKITVLRHAGAATDHPIDPSYPEGAYLTSGSVQVEREIGYSFDMKAKLRIEIATYYAAFNVEIGWLIQTNIPTAIPLQNQDNIRKSQRGESSYANHCLSMNQVEQEVEIGGRGRVGDATMEESGEGTQNVVATATGRGVGTCKGLSLEQRAEMVRIFNGYTTENVLKVHGSTLAGKHSNTLAGSSFGVSEVESRGKRKAVGAAPNSIIDMFDSKAREEADDAIGKLFYTAGIPFNVARSPYYKEAMTKVAKAGTNYVPPGDTKLRTTILDRNSSTVNLLMEEMKVTWVSHGCSIIMDGWTDIRHCPLINVIVSCKDGPYFLRAIDCSGKRKDVEFQYQIFKNAIGEVGLSNVVQVVTDAAYVRRATGKLVEREYWHIYWTPWCVHAMNNALKGIGKIQWVNQIVTEARDVQNVIKYGDSNSPNLGEIYECIDNMHGQMKATIEVRDPTLEFYNEHIQPIIQQRWEKLNTPLHMVGYALNPKWYVERPGRVIPLDDDEEASQIRMEWLDFAELDGYKTSAKADKVTIAQEKPVSWWQLYGLLGLLRPLAICLLSQVSNSSAFERNWSTYGWIHSVKRNKFTSTRAKKLVVVHSVLCLMDRKTPEYNQTPALRWDVDPEEPRQVEEDNIVQRGLIGLTFEDKDASTNEEFMDITSDVDSDF
ncbi:hypothetical protein KI387_014220 [Taxus chinensis]|uniref:DUF659 domain-containing protein n=1 Tax=Taxus chinensis TaxID=29808 RepID=A0AA38FI03_TAXCH|nr:hypothetical protein KI387_014220 [Taxus chinensis]